MDEKLTIRKILTLIQVEYPNSFSNMDERMMAAKEELWRKEFSDDDLTLVYAAVRLYMKGPERFAPSIGQIRQKMQTLVQPTQLTEQEAWNLVSRACQNGIYGYKREFEKLPPEVQRAVGTPEQIREWAKMPADTVQTVIASNFMRSFSARQKRDQELSMLPESVREKISSVADNFKLPGGD